MVNRVLFADGGRRAVAATDGHQILAWDLPGGVLAMEVRTALPVQSMDIGPRGQIVYSQGARVRVLPLRSRSQLPSPRQLLAGAVRAAGLRLLGMELLPSGFAPAPPAR